MPYWVILVIFDSFVIFYRPTTTNTLEDYSESKKSPDNKGNDDLF